MLIFSLEDITLPHISTKNTKYAVKIHKINGERYSLEHIIENHTIGPEIKEKYIPPSCGNLPSSHNKYRGILPVYTNCTLKINEIVVVFFFNNHMQLKNSQPLLLNINKVS